MARPAMRDPAGRWSLTQIAQAAHITHRTARTITTRGYLGDPTQLTQRHITIARVAAHLLDAPRPTPTTPTTQQTTITETRNTHALHLTNQAINNPNPEHVLLITPTQAALHDRILKLMADLDTNTNPLLLLPIGNWIDQTNTALTTKAKATQ